MFMSYSVMFFLAGLTILVCTPLIKRDGWNAESNVSILFTQRSKYATLVTNSVGDCDVLPWHDSSRGC